MGDTVRIDQTEYYNARAREALERLVPHLVAFMVESKTGVWQPEFHLHKGGVSKIKVCLAFDIGTK
jgi:hypothetical protein